MCATEVVIRQGSSRDCEPVGEFLAGLSVTTRQRRFFDSLPHAGPALVRTLAVAEAGKFVLLALDGEVVVGHGMAVWSSARTADFGIVVTDAYQHRGIGGRLLRGLIHGCADPRGQRTVLRHLERELPRDRLAEACAAGHSVRPQRGRRWLGDGSTPTR
jgi:GNAT superfamily N-acetyltransferase